MSGLPLISGRQPDEALAWRADGAVTVREFVAQARSLAAQLPAGRWVINLCEDRYHFAVSFAACLLSGKTSLQPSSHSPATLQQLARDYPGAWCLVDGDRASDSDSDAGGLPVFHFPAPADERDDGYPDAAVPVIAADHLAAILFTSGSTGLPQAHGKTWGKLVMNGQAEARGLMLNARPFAIVGTVPAQHSYGFESTFLLALHGGCSFWAGKPFYPQDVVQALAAVPRPRMLVTTPYHLSAVLTSGVTLPALDAVLSATAPLSEDLARNVEAQTHTQVQEIYGSTESSALASRRTTDGAAWQLLPEVVLEQEDGTTFASGGHVEGRVPLADVISLLPDRQFLLHGRLADSINIAGKRTSLAYLNHQLTSIAGVCDGAFYLPDDAGTDSITRLSAFVVAPQLQRSDLMHALRQRIDPVFLPRPLVWVDALPRNSTGKLPRSVLQALYLEKVTHGRG